MPKPHTPFQWAGQASAETIDHRLRLLRQKINEDRRIGRSIGLRYHDGKPGVIEGLLSRGDRRVGRVIERVWRDGGKFDGWSEHFSFDRWTTAAAEELAPFGVDLDWFTTRERTEHEVLPWDHLDSGLDKEWLWEDWQEAHQRGGGRRLPVDPLLRLRRLPDHGHRDPDRPHRAQPAPAHRRLMARQPDGPPPPPTVQKLRIRYAKRGRLRFASPPRPRPHAGAGAAPRAGADGVLGRVQPAPRRSPTSARRPPARRARRSTSRSGLSVRCDPEAVRAALDAALPEDVAVLECVEAGEGTGSLADRIDTSVWRVELPGVTLAELQPAVEAFLASDVVTVAKRTKNGLKDIDAREAVTSASAAEEAGCAILHMVVRQLTPAVRPDDVLAALAAVADLHPPLPARAVREAQGRLDDTGTVADPLGPDRAARILRRRSTRRSDRRVAGAARRQRHGCQT